MSDATGLSRPTIRAGRREIESRSIAPGRIRRAGAGRPSIEQSQPGIKQALERLVDPLTRGDPESALRWTCKSRAKLTAALSKAGWKVSSTTVSRLLHELGYRFAIGCARVEKGHRTRTATRNSSTSIRRQKSFYSALSRWSRSTRRRRNWSAISGTAAGSGNRRASPSTPWCTIFPKTLRAKRFPTESMTWDVTKRG